MLYKHYKKIVLNKYRVYRVWAKKSKYAEPILINE